MCGIAGILALIRGLSKESLTAQLKSMTNAQSHRGPDDQGIWCDGTCALGHRRLSKIGRAHV